MGGRGIGRGVGVVNIEGHVCGWVVGRCRCGTADAGANAHTRGEAAVSIGDR